MIYSEAELADTTDDQIVKAGGVLDGSFCVLIVELDESTTKMV
jgi:hypothetical protein